MEVRKPEDDGYVTPAAAISSIIHYVGHEAEAKRMISDGLRSGRIQCIAEYVWGTNLGDVRGEWVPRRFNGFQYFHDAEINPTLWMESRQWPKDTLFWRWGKSEFVIFISEEDEDKLDRIYFKNIRLMRKDVTALVGRSNRSGGPKSDRERWAMFWVTVLKTYTRNFDWTQYNSPTDLKKAFLEATVSEDLFSDGNVNFAVAFAWEHLVKQSAGERLVATDRTVSD